ncbi:sigma-70 family RNA polymerase sigma factor [Arthrobacter methylotrophus]|uniref:RNA polymerase sigma factor n=1 Tax=Arthrobacter methylotrophus TaxID=121291 RepID=UPI0031E95791
MTQETRSSPTQPRPWHLEGLSDGELLEAVRAGSSEEYGILFERYRRTALRVASRYSSDTHLAEDAVHEAFASILSAIRSGFGPSQTFGPYLYSSVINAMRRLNLRKLREKPMDIETLEGAIGRTDERFAGVTTDDLVQTVLRSLPPRWQEVLWYLEVEAMAPREVGPILGLTPNATVALHRRAKVGLRLGYLRELLPTAENPACHNTSKLIPTYALGILKDKQIVKMKEHLKSCTNCATSLSEVLEAGIQRRSPVAPGSTSG